MSEISIENSIELKLGYIIKIYANDTILNNNIFYIYYLKNNSKIKLINLGDNQQTEILIINNMLDPEKNVTSIEILHIPTEEGFARQQNLVTGKFVSLVFDTEDEDIENKKGSFLLSKGTRDPVI